MLILFILVYCYMGPCYSGDGTVWYVIFTGTNLERNWSNKENSITSTYKQEKRWFFNFFDDYTIILKK